MNATTKEQVKQLRHEHKDWSSETIAKQVGVTKQRVHKILKDEGLPTKRQIEKIFSDCINCGEMSTNPNYCSADCRKIHNTIIVKCDTCNKERLYSRATYTRALTKNQKHFYCSRPCFYQGNRKRFPVQRAKDRLLLPQDVVQ